MAKRPSESKQVRNCKGTEALVNTGEPWPAPDEAWARVRRMQTRLHRWAVDDPGRRFDDLFNLVYHPDFLTVAWERVQGNKGARTAGVDGIAPMLIGADPDIVVAFLDDARQKLKSRRFVPLPVRERMIPKPGGAGKLRRLGIPAAMDRLVQASLVLVLEPIFEADFKPVSYGFRPNRRALDAIAEVQRFATQGYEWVFEADITACFDELSHGVILDRVRRWVGDKRVLGLVKAFLKAGVMTADGSLRESDTGTPQGGIATPPTQSITRLMVTLRIGAAGFVGALGGAWAAWDAVADGDVLGPDEDVFDDESQDPLAFVDVGGVGAVV